MRMEELVPTVERDPLPAKIKGRRRPGRIDQVSPNLIPLLRNPPTADIPELLPGEVDLPPLEDEMAPATGIMFGLALSIPIWAAIAGTIWAVLR